MGAPSTQRGFRDGLVLGPDGLESGTGGGLCQLSNLLYWMALQAPVRVTEHHHHGSDLFPDDDRVQPFGSGATVFFNYVDLRFLNETDRTFQLRAWLTDIEAARPDPSRPSVPPRLPRRGAGPSVRARAGRDRDPRERAVEADPRRVEPGRSRSRSSSHATGPRSATRSIRNGARCAACHVATTMARCSRRTPVPTGPRGATRDHEPGQPDQMITVQTVCRFARRRHTARPALRAPVTRRASRRSCHRCSRARSQIEWALERPAQRPSGELLIEKGGRSVAATRRPGHQVAPARDS